MCQLAGNVISLSKCFLICKITRTLFTGRCESIQGAVHRKCLHRERSPNAALDYRISHYRLLQREPWGRGLQVGEQPLQSPLSQDLGTFRARIGAIPPFREPVLSKADEGSEGEGVKCYSTLHPFGRSFYVTRTESQSPYCGLSGLHRSRSHFVK